MASPRSGHCRRLEPGEPAEGHAGQAAEGVVRIPRRTAGDREETAELGVHQRQEHHATAPMIQEISAAGPATTTAFWAPYSQPDPMMEPTEAHIRPINPLPAEGAG